MKAQRMLTMLCRLTGMSLVFVLVAAKTFTQGTWISKASMPTARGAPAAAQLNGKIITTGGGDSSGTISFTTVEEYDIVTDSWVAKAPFPMPNHLHAMIVGNGIVYSIGGAGGANVAYERFGDLYAYDPLSDSWNPKASLLQDRAYHGLAVINGLIYVVGGTGENRDGTPRLASMEVYNPVSDTWTNLAPMSNPRYGLGVASVIGLHYAIGGAVISDSVGTVEVYDPTTDSWSFRQSMPTPRQGLTVEVVNGIIYAIGGFSNGNGTGKLNTVEAYDPVANTWSPCTPMPTARGYAASATSGGTIFVLGGPGDLDSSNLAPITAVVEAFTPHR